VAAGPGRVSKHCDRLAAIAGCDQMLCHADTLLTPKNFNTSLKMSALSIFDSIEIIEIVDTH